MSTPKKLTGRVPPEAIRRLTLDRVSPDVIQRVAALEDLTGNLSDAMDQLGLVGVIPASILKPSLPLKRMVGQAVTVRNVERASSPLHIAQTGKGKMGEHEAYNLAEPGDVVVIEGLLNISNMGGQSAMPTANAAALRWTPTRRGRLSKRATGAVFLNKTSRYCVPLRSVRNWFEAGFERVDVIGLLVDSATRARPAPA